MDYLKSLVLLFFTTIGCSISDSNSPLDTSHALMSYSDYCAKKRGPWPYIFSLEQKSQYLCYFGANHSVDPFDQQYVLLEETWNQFLAKTSASNCVVLVEGSLKRLALSREESIKECGAEGGFITFLARNIPEISIECPEPTQELTDEYLSTFFETDVIVYTRYAQAVLWAIRRHKTDSQLSMEKMLQDYSIDVELMQKIHERYFNEPFNLNDELFFYSITNPALEISIINEVCRKSSIFRDLHCVSYMENLIEAGKNIFTVYGGTHAVMQEPAIRAVWEKVSRSRL